jgi:hypothetical protein
VFSKESRYRQVPDVTVSDARGRLVFAKDIRPFPDVTGTYQHVVNAGDRLDQLAWTYYGQPLQYWRICDANPAFLSPLALLAEEALVTTRFPVTPKTPDADPPWSALLKALSAQIGVDDITVVEDVTVEQHPRTVDGGEVLVTTERFSRAVVITYNRVNLDTVALAEVIDRVGFKVDTPVDGGQVGQPIIVPVAVGG